MNMRFFANTKPANFTSPVKDTPARLKLDLFIMFGSLILGNLLRVYTKKPCQRFQLHQAVKKHGQVQPHEPLM